jgi:hypothetical protein
MFQGLMRETGVGTTLVGIRFVIVGENDFCIRKT